ncbi:hypothetical protein FRC04_011862 [Tulasnella sp. 424]|nr:hypothetical protein FRC04_011862 [Tulasnella sp. 424]
MNEDKATSEIGSPTPPTRHEEFYYEDGNICLQAENTIFRLLKSQLARQSDMFTDMFFVGGEQQGILVEGEVYDGVPLVRVEERAEDWTIVCQLLWNPPADERPKDFDTIASVLRISTKYSMDKLRKCFVKWFEEATLHSAHRFGANPLPILEHYDSKPNLAAKVIVVTKECDVQSVLPVALYYVAVTSSSTLSRPIGLPYDDVVRIMIGRDRLLVKWWNLSRTWTKQTAMWRIQVGLVAVVPESPNAGGRIPGSP